MSKRLFSLLALLTVSSLLLAACGGAGGETGGGELGEVVIAPGDPIHIAWIQTVTGATGPLGLTNVRGGEVALNEIGFELLGHPIQWDGEDSLCSAEGGQAAGTRVASDPTVVAVMGTTCSSEARTAMPLLAEAGMLMISPSNTNPDLTNPEHPDAHFGYFRTAHNDLFQGRVAAEFAYNELGVRTAATIHDGSPYAESLQQVFADVFTELGGDITAQAAVNVGDTDMGGILADLATGAPELIYFPIFEPEGNFVADQACDATGLEGTILMGADGLLTSTFPPAAGECSVGMYLSGPYVDPGVQSTFLETYNQAFGEGPAAGFAPHSYDAVKMILAAIEQVAVVESDGTVRIDRQALIEAMYGISGFAGLTGTLTCDENGDCATGEALAIFQISAENVAGTADLLTNAAFWTP